jgi:leader peptidase (prepilin peptidase)/N-methyltransferase
MFDLTWSIFIFGLGAIIGSFLNVVIFRYQTGMSITYGKSICLSCNRKLSWLELVPIFSFLAQKGRCRNCLSKISWQYPAVELTTACLFLATYWHLGGVDGMETNLFKFILTIFIFCLLIVISVYDLRHKIIPDTWVYSLVVLTFILTPASIYFASGTLPWYEWVAGPLVASPFAFLFLVSRGTWMGLGDAKLALGIGWFLGLSLGISAIIWGFWIGAIYGLVIMALGLKYKGKKITIKSEIPFAPFLILGWLLVYFFGWDLIHLNVFL